MPQIEINSPLTNSQVRTGFHVTGWTDRNNWPVTCVVSGASGSQTLSTSSDADGNWDAGPTSAGSVPVGTDYSVASSITVGTDSFSDGNEGIDVCNGINAAIDPIPILISGFQFAKLTARTELITVRGRYSTPNPARIIVMVLVLRRRKVRVYSAEVIDNPTTGNWSTQIIAPDTPNARRVAVMAIRMRSNGTTSGKTTLRV